MSSRVVLWMVLACSLSFVQFSVNRLTLKTWYILFNILQGSTKNKKENKPGR